MKQMNRSIYKEKKQKKPHSFIISHLGIEFKSFGLNDIAILCR